MFWTPFNSAPRTPPSGRPGECYEISVTGDGGSNGLWPEGDYALSLKCTIANTTAIPVDCGSVVTGSTAGLPSLRGSSAGAKRHMFCPNKTYTAQVSTCGSSFDTVLYINGSDVNLQSQYSDDLCDQETVTFDFTSGECYDIIVGGFSYIEEGTYVLSIDCFLFECGSTFSGSTIGLRGSVKTHLFCPTERQDGSKHLRVQFQHRNLDQRCGT